MKRFLLALIISYISTGCSRELDCGSNEAKELIKEIALEQHLYLDYIFTNSDQFRNTEIFKSIMEGANIISLGLTPNQNFIDEFPIFKIATHSLPIFNDFVDSYKNSASAKLEDIIMTKKENDTGSLSCKGKLSVDVDGWGGAEAIKDYKIEKTSEGELYATLYI
jgi:hypothetical protein